MKKWLATTLLAVAVLGFALPLQAQDASNPDELMRVIAKLQKKVDQLEQGKDGRVDGLLIRVKQLEEAQAATRQAISEGFRRTESLASKLDNAAVSDFAKWAGKVKWGGDFRYRHEFIDDESKSDERNRHRMRARLSLEAHPCDDLDFYVRLASGSSDPVSTNQSLDNCFTSKGLWLDKAYFDWHPESLGGIHLLAGKMGVPFHKPGKEQLIWDGDLNPEGMALKYSHALSETTKVNLVGGGFWVNEHSSSADQLLYAGQLSLASAVSEDVKVTLGGTYYHFTNTKGQTVCADEEDPFGNTAIEQDDGTFLYAEDFRLVEGFAEIGMKLGGMPVSLYGDYVNNMEADSGEDTGWLVGVKLNKAKKPGTWDLGYNWRDVEADSVVGAFTDSDFVGGGSNGRGHKVSAGYMLTKCLKLGLTYFHTFQDLNSGGNDNYKRLQVDLKLKF